MRTSNPDCPFCEIVSRDDPDVREIYRDDVVVAFFPTEPATLGHTLIIPRNHVPYIWDLDPEVASRLAQATVDISAAVNRAVHPDGLNIIQSNGKAATQTVPHLHVHVVPRWESDSLGRIWPPETNFPSEAKDQAWRDLRDECRKLNS